jgi:hypothetical protein
MTSERANPTVLDLVATALRAQGFDGLFYYAKCFRYSKIYC